MHAFTFSNDYCPFHEYRQSNVNFAYVAEILIEYGRDSIVCTCRREDTDGECNASFFFNTVEWVSPTPKPTYIRVASEVNGVLSDFLPYQRSSDRAEACSVTSISVDSKSNVIN